MNVLIVGGTGFLGYHATHELLRRGHTVTVLARRPVSNPGLFPPGVRTHSVDINQLAPEAVQDLIRGHQGVIFAAGADVPGALPKPAYDYFYRENVVATARFFKLAREAGATRGVLLGSYFTYFDRTWPELHLAERHPYIRSRKEQAVEAFAAASPDMELMILELPYIFGAMPGRTPLWAPLVRYVKSPLPLVYTRGGTAMIAVQHVAEAIAGALEQGKGGESYTIGEENLPWSDFLERLSHFAGKRRKVITVPSAMVRPAMAGIGVYWSMLGRESGLAPGEFFKVQTANTYFDPEPSRQALGYGKGGLDEAFRATVEASLSR